MSRTKWISNPTIREKNLWSFLPTLLALAILFSAFGQAAAQGNNATNDDVYSVDDDGILDSNATTVIPGSIVARPATAVTVADAVLFPWFVQFLGCLTVFVLSRFNLPVPFAAVMFIFGALMGYGAVTDQALEDPTNDVRKALLDSITLWINIDSATLLLIFLPGLIFKDAVDIPINLFVVAAGEFFKHKQKNENDDNINPLWP